MKGSRILGTHANSVHGQGDAEAALAAREGRYKLLRSAQSILWNRDAESPKDLHRTCWCHRAINSGTQTADVIKRADGMGARFSGMVNCGSVWTCPVCGGKIAEQRRRDIEETAMVHAKLGGSLYLMTLTFPHEHGQGLADLLELFAKALQRFKNSRTYKRLLGGCLKKVESKYERMRGSGGAWNRIGSVRSLEVTCGPNGWHPHTHDLVFVDQVQDIDDQAQRAPAMYSGDVADLRDAWITALRKVGLDGGRPTSWLIQRAFQVQGGAYAAEYIAKWGRDITGWGVTREMTGNVAKVGGVRTDDDIHATPMQLLQWAGSGDGQAAEQFKEFAAAMHGKRMLSWSPGLRSVLKLSEVMTDEEIQERVDADPAPEERVVGQIDAVQLKTIIRINRMGEFLSFVAMYAETQQDIDEWVMVMDRQQSFGSSHVRVKRVFGGGFAEADL